MTPQRFFLLTEAYGAEIGHWPASEQDAAHALIARQLPEINTALAEAAKLDLLLSSEQPEAPLWLTENIIASAPGRAATPRENSRSWWQVVPVRIGLTGTALASAGIAGALAGAFCVTMWTSGMLPESSADAQSLTADFVDLEQDWAAS